MDRSPGKLSEGDIDAVFSEVQAGRFARAAASLEQGRRTSWLSMRDTVYSRLFVHYLFPWFGDRINMWFAVTYAETGPVVEKLPLPCRRGVTLPHAGTVKEKGRGGNLVPCGLAALGATLTAVLVCSKGGPGWPELLAAPFSRSLGRV